MNQEDIKPNIPFWIEELLEMKKELQEVNTKPLPLKSDNLYK